MTKREVTATITTFWEARGERDQTEGRGGQFVVGVFTTYEQAHRAAQSRGVMGTEGYVEEKTYVTIGDKTYELGSPVEVRTITLAEEKAKILAKLTPDEQRILGL